LAAALLIVTWYAPFAADTSVAVSQSDKLFAEQRYDDALTVLSQAVAAVEAEAPRLEIAEMISRRGLELFQLGKYSKAIDYYVTALRIEQLSDDKPAAIRTQNNLGRLYNLVGDYSSARATLTEAQRQSRALNDPELVALTLINQGHLSLNLRDYAEAITYLDEAESLAQRLPPKSLLIEALLVSGAVYRQQGDFERALGYYARAEDIIDKNTALAGYRGITARVIGELYLHRKAGPRAGNLQLAEHYLSAALATHRAQGDALGSAMARSHLGELDHQRGDYEAAMGQFEAALAYFRGVDYRDGIGRMHVHLGFAQGEAGEWKAAVSSFDDAIAVYEALGDREWLRVSWFGRGVYLERVGEIERAVSSYKRAVEVFESLRAGVAGGREAEDLFTRVNVELYQNLVALLIEQTDYETALEYVERSRLEAMRSGLLKGLISGRTKRGPEDATQALAENLKAQMYYQDKAGQERDPKRRGELIETLARTEKETRRLVFQLMRRYPDRKLTLELEPDTRSFRNSDAFPLGLALVTYFFERDHLLIFVVRKGDALTVKRVKVVPSEVRDRVAKAIGLIWLGGEIRTDRDSAKLDAELERELGELYNVLIAPVEDTLQDAQTLAVLPSAWLNYLPFEALISPGTQPKYLVETRNIVYLSAHTSAEDAWNEGVERTPNDKLGIVAFGNPTSGREDLPAAREEVETIRRLYPSSTVFVEQEATKENFKVHWGRHQVIHVAAHAELEGSDAKILLAPPKTGTLFVEEFFDLPTNLKTVLVVLSACQTALDPALSKPTWGTDADSSREIVATGGPLGSAAHALIFAGVPSVTGTLWKVDDEASARLMQGLYTNLKQGHGYYGALRQAQIDMLSRTDRFRRPYYWAGYVFYGRDQ